MKRRSPLTLIAALVVALAALVVALAALSACSTTKRTTATSTADTTSDTTGTVPPNPDGSTITLAAYDSFVLSKGVLEGFTKDTGIKVKVLTLGDGGEMVNKSVLSKDAPLGDVMWGVDNTFLSRATTEGLFQRTAVSTADLDPAYVALAPDHTLVPVDFGDVCVNYDKAALAAKHVTPPQTFADLTKPEYKDMLVVENPATSSTGLAFLLGSYVAAGTSDWHAWWTALKANGTLVVDGWSAAYDTHFSAGAGKGDRPLVVSYASSPPAAVLFGPDPKATESPTGVSEGTCFRQVEFAGVLKGTKHVAEAEKLLAFLTGPAVQEDMQLNMFVFPVNTKTTLAEAFTKFAAKPSAPLTLPPADIAAKRDTLIDEWSAIML